MNVRSSVMMRLSRTRWISLVVLEVKMSVTQKIIYRDRNNPIMTLDEDQNIFLVTYVIHILKN